MSTMGLPFFTDNIVFFSCSALLILEKTVRSKDDLDELMRNVFDFKSDWCEDIKQNAEGIHSFKLYFDCL